MHTFGERGGYILANEISFDRQLAMAAIDQDRELDAARPAEISQSIHGRANGAAAKENVINNYYRLSGDVKGNDCGEHFRGDALVQVIPMHADIETPGGGQLSVDGLKYRRQALRQENSTPLDPDQDEILIRFIAFSDFMRDSGQRPLHRGGIQDNGGGRHVSQDETVDEVIGLGYWDNFCQSLVFAKTPAFTWRLASAARKYLVIIDCLRNLSGLR